MIKIDMWYNDKPTDADNADVFFNDLDCKYRGNMYKAGKIIGDYVCTDTLELEKAFPQLVFDWNWGGAEHELYTYLPHCRRIKNQ